MEEVGEVLSDKISLSTITQDGEIRFFYLDLINDHLLHDINVMSKKSLSRCYQ